MNKLLFIITRAQDEFELYWQSKEVYNSYPNKITYIINGFYLEGYEDNFCDEFSTIIQNRKINLTDTEIGVIFHGEIGNRNVDCLENQDIKITFFKRYSSTETAITEGDGNNFTAGLCNGEKPLDRLRDAVNNCKNSDYSKAFDDVWSFFLGDPVLEAKLELLHQYLTTDGVKDVRKISNYTLIKDKVENVKIKPEGEDEIPIVDYLSKQSDCFDKVTYIDPLTDLRDALLAD